MGVEPTTFEFRLQRKAIKDILLTKPEGIEEGELIKLAEAKGISGDEFQKALTSLLNAGHAYRDKSGRLHYVRNE